MPRNNSRDAKIKARTARQTKSVAEAIMWEHLRSSKTGYKFRREHPIGPFRLDFFCFEAKLAVEMDGEQHDPDYDAARDDYFAGRGILTYRVPNRRFFGLDEGDYINDVCEIVRLCERRTGQLSLDKIPSISDSAGNPRSADPPNG